MSMFHFARRGAGQLSSAMSDDAPDDPFSRWGAGVIAAILPAIIGTIAILSERAYFLGGRPLRVVQYGGNDAIALGVACVAVGLFMHAHYFWTVSRFYFVSEILKPISLLIIAGGIGYVLVNQFVFM